MVVAVEARRIARPIANLSGLRRARDLVPVAPGPATEAARPAEVMQPAEPVTERRLERLEAKLTDLSQLKGQVTRLRKRNEQLEKRVTDLGGGG